MVNPIKVIKGLIEVEEQLADFIQNGPGTGLGGFVRDRYRDRCNEFANLPPWARALSGITGGSIKRFCTPYWDDNSWDGPVNGTPATGGQCATLYTVFSQIRNPNTGVPTTPGESNQGTITGPIEIVKLDPAPEGCIGGSFGEASLGVRTVGNPGVQIPIHGAGCVLFNQLISLRFERVDGLPDDCGDPPADVQPGPNPPPNPGPLPGPEPTDNPDPENPIPFFPIPPFEDPVFGPLPITGFDESPGGGEPGPPAGGDGLPGDDDAIGGAAGEVNGDEPGQDIDFGPPPEGRIWVGCIVDLIVDSRIGNIPGTAPQSTVWPSVRGNVALKYASFFGTSYRINSRYTELFRPNTSLIVTGCFLQVQPGGSGLVFPVSALKCPSNPCGEENE